MEIRVLGAHNRETRTTRCVSLLIDRSMVIDAGSLFASLPIAGKEDFTSILLTHQHYDHIKDIPMVAIACYRDGLKVDVYATKSVCRDVQSCLFNGNIYPNFHYLPGAQPTVNFRTIVPGRETRIGEYEVLALPVAHVNGSVGYQVSDSMGKTLFYTGDTGPGLTGSWNSLSPQLMVIEVTVPDRLEDFARRTGHLTPRLLGEELKLFSTRHGYLPRIAVIHMEPSVETEIVAELGALQEGLGAPITILSEGMVLQV